LESFYAPTAYPGDISGVEWDDQLNLLWVLSDEAERYEAATISHSL